MLGLAPVVLSFFLNLRTAQGYDNLLGNGGFEQGTPWWATSPGATFFTVTEPVSSGNWATALNRSDAMGEIYVQQEVDVLPGATYTLTAWVYVGLQRRAKVRLRPPGDRLAGLRVSCPGEWRAHGR